MNCVQFLFIVATTFCVVVTGKNNNENSSNRIINQEEITFSPSRRIQTVLRAAIRRIIKNIPDVHYLTKSFAAKTSIWINPNSTTLLINANKLSNVTLSTFKFILYTRQISIQQQNNWQVNKRYYKKASKQTASTRAYTHLVLSHICNKVFIHFLNLTVTTSLSMGALYYYFQSENKSFEESTWIPSRQEGLVTVGNAITNILKVLPVNSTIIRANIIIQVNPDDSLVIRVNILEENTTKNKFDFRFIKLAESVPLRDSERTEGVFLHKYMKARDSLNCLAKKYISIICAMV